MTKIINRESIEKSIDFPELINQIEKYYQKLNSGKVGVTSRIFTDTKDGGKYIIGGATNFENESFIVMSQPVMPWYAEEGLPVATTSYIYSSFRTGEIKAIVGGADLVKYRTPAKSALAAKYLAPKKTSYTLGLIGLGVQAVTHTEAFSKLFNITKILGTSRHPEKWQKNIDEIELKTNLKLELTDIDKLVERSDIVVVITSATQPLVKFSMLHKGQLVIGTDHAETVAKDVALNAEKVFVDYRPTAENEPATIRMLLEEGHAYEEIVDGDLLQLTGGALPGRESEDEIIFFQSLGVLNENLAAVEYLYDKLKNEAEEIVF